MLLSDSHARMYTQANRWRIGSFGMKPDPCTLTGLGLVCSLSLDLRSGRDVLPVPVLYCFGYLLQALNRGLQRNRAFRRNQRNA